MPRDYFSLSLNSPAPGDFTLHGVNNLMPRRRCFSLTLGKSCCQQLALAVPECTGSSSTAEGEGLSPRPDENGANVVLWAFLMCFLCFQAFEQTDQEQHRRTVEASATSRDGGEEEAQPGRIRASPRTRGKSTQGRAIRLALFSFEINLNTLID